VTDLLIVLHAHLPWGQLSSDEDLAARWLLEASVDCYQPLLEALEELEREGISFRLTLSVSAPLASMWRSALFAPRLAAYVEVEQSAWANLPAAYSAAADFHLARLQRPRRDLLAGFRRLAGVETICATATHGFLPLLSTVPAAARAQVEAAVAEHREAFGAAPPGMWLAECGYCPSADRWLLDAGVGYFFVDTHAVAHSKHKAHAAVRTRSGVAAFARDPEASEQVWSRTAGYPGNPAYLDFHHRIGGRRVLKVPGEGAWDPLRARAQAQAHARDFVKRREATAARGAAVVVAPYDAELFGHWWFEGPDFLATVLREASQSKALRLATASDHLREQRDLESIALPASSWGRGGHSAVWLDPSNAWIWPHLHRAAERMVLLARGAAGDLRVLGQAARELLLAQASDWPFLIESNTNASYARRRVEDHLVAFRALASSLERGTLDEVLLQTREAKNGIFPHLDARLFGRE
jgi:1,4-alpha-glucan branching enzyme